ncbi:T9SS type A sorting domain-containing protein [Formosa sediminum]|uniref:T9SS type A sorting domain-containing protein n=1 Tax=Formosa sediminum TaxID=2594004 RepID=A0A516GP20_9FLAO|nr:T9SS type A sorting domain-containing protein [Formosa sediminum]
MEQKSIGDLQKKETFFYTSGRLIQDFPIKTADNNARKITIDLSRIPSGTYIVYIFSTSNQTTTKRLIVN